MKTIDTRRTMPRPKSKYGEYHQVKLPAHLIDHASTLASHQGLTLGDWIGEQMQKGIDEQMPAYLEQLQKEFNKSKKGK